MAFLFEKIGGMGQTDGRTASTLIAAPRKGRIIITTRCRT